MAFEVLTQELGRIALRKLAELDMKEATSAVKALGKASTGAALLPGLGAFGAGVVLGAGITLLVAPQSGKQTRALIARKFRALTGRDAASSAAARVPDDETIETRGTVVS